MRTLLPLLNVALLSQKSKKLFGSRHKAKKSAFPERASPLRERVAERRSALRLGI